MLLAIDIGNTNITLGIWQNKWQHQWRLHTEREKTADEYGILLKGLLREHGIGQISHAMLCSVVPPLTTTFHHVCRQYLHTAVSEIHAGLDLGITINVDVPEAVGADRLVNAAAAYHLFPGPSIVIDMGTATKLEVITADGQFIGGVIAPGLGLAADALATKAAKLSQVPLTAPPSVIGRNTSHAMQSGIILGYVSLIEGLVQRIKAVHPNRDEAIYIVGTGGLIPLVAGETAVFDHVDPWLTLTGLQIIYQRLRGEILND